MISSQSHNQVLYHLTQLLSACRPKTSSYSRINKKEINPNSNCDKLCQESFNEATKNLNELLWENMDLNKLLRLQPSQRLQKKREIKKIVDKLNNTLYIIDKQLSIDDKNNWKVSYTSGSNFADNKRGIISYSLLVSGVDTNFNCCYKKDATLLYHVPATIPGQYISTRGFKTSRNITAERERNPSLAGRLKTWFGLSKIGEEKLKLAVNRMDMEQLKNLLTNSELSNADKQSIKIAFAEGYLAGNERKPPVRSFKWIKILQQILSPIMFIIVCTILLVGNGGMFRIPLGSYTAIDPEEINVTFDDVKGVTEAKQELKDVVEFLKNPEKFSALGGRLPKGVLLVGPPGTGKTLLARAVAGEAHVPFFHAAGPEFDEVLVGQGAKRVRDLFRAAKERAPCVIFIDEIDSVGGKRTTSLIHPYANQTINQLLSEMDGFQQNEGVIVLGATNRRDDLDKALRRPGRFDVEIYVHKPDLKDRKEIIELYLSKILAKSLDVDALARATTGFTGADIESMVNQAALKAAIDGADYVTMDHLEKAREKVIMGPELKGRMPDLEENRITAYHEAGHALVSFYSKEAMPLAKVTIIPRAGSLGHTSSLPKKDIYHQTKQHLLAAMDTSLGGRAAEELIFGMEKITVGAASDLQKATQIAEAMVKNYGMSEKAGFRVETQDKQNKNGTELSPNTAEIIDSEVKRLLQESYDRAKSILKTHAKEHKLLAEALLKYETLDAEEVKDLLNEKKVDSIGEKRAPIIDVPTNVM